MAATVLQKRSIKSLYPLALAEGEGVGTAYEYFAKRLILGRWLESAETHLDACRRFARKIWM